MTGNTEKQDRFWTQQEVKSWHPKATPPSTSRDRKSAGTANGRMKQPGKPKRSA
jgi:hypothetical protein